ncbi:zinc-ribbon and DUF3426 domain-containing protein [Marinomonas communis]|uniref:Putative Zn finger-like uncharacterized protein n=1 Tax=Marinomonas communis TaxID=28254 RepID=A0A4R6XDP4_9GAMM|nr:zinc-ribbon and DUF3426 domain-containing protein [Marinomonas communis]TDR15724.1 putative Zn finger-like uncharacterized protein [Marinomonas communis]
MSESMITRCPKCSTTFRVTQEVLNMAKGKVRCGQCFHIFTASPVSSNQNKSTQSNPVKPTKPQQQANPKAPLKQLDVPSKNTASSAQLSSATPVSDDGSVNPEWLNTLFHEEDLAPYTPPKNTNARFTEQMDLDDEQKTSVLDNPILKTPKTPYSEATQPRQEKANEELAPWELELAELDAQMSAQSPASEPVFSEQIKPEPSRNTVQPKASTEEKQTSPATEEPDYMQALHSLAQDVSKKDAFDEEEYSSQESMKQLAAEYSLATLTDHSDTKTKSKTKNKHTALWSLGCFAALLLLATQVAIGYFDVGSRSPEFRGLYKTACAYLGCTLPAFEDVDAITTEHVRIQSHPTAANTLQVNAIMTNTSSFAQPMPKLALEFYDLNGRPVAARLFAPQDYLHKDFLDITFMPPSTPIHIVIPIQDPGARAVTHQIKVFPSETQSY